MYCRGRKNPKRELKCHGVEKACRKKRNKKVTVSEIS